MKREILFRGKRVIDGKWFEGLLCEVFNGNLRLTPHIQFSNERKDTLHYVEVIPETVCEFTGLTDKNGVKIFNGDIVKSIFKYQDTIKYIIGIVEIDKCNPCFVIHYKFEGNGHDCYEYDFIQCGLRHNEVIGNIYDNPEIL